MLLDQDGQYALDLLSGKFALMDVTKKLTEGKAPPAAKMVVTYDLKTTAAPAEVEAFEQRPREPLARWSVVADLGIPWVGVGLSGQCGFDERSHDRVERAAEPDAAAVGEGFDANPVFHLRLGRSLRFEHGCFGIGIGSASGCGGGFCFGFFPGKAFELAVLARARLELADGKLRRLRRPVGVGVGGGEAGEDRDLVLGLGALGEAGPDFG